MTTNRIQKLLFSEYSDFEDMVLIESPFAQTTRDGVGIRQVQMGLTPTKLILAMDMLKPADCPFIMIDDVDPEIESFELISLFPVECVNISVFRRRTRNTLKAHFCNNQVLYFELATSQKREMFWNLWCERVKFLCPEESKSTQSETSVGSSTSASTLYCKYQHNSRPYFSPEFLPVVNDSLVYHQKTLMKNRAESGQSCSPSHSSYTHESNHGSEQVTKCRSMLTVSNRSEGCSLVNRFGDGVAENCHTGLYLPNNYNKTDSDLPPPPVQWNSMTKGKSEITCKMNKVSAWIEHEPTVKPKHHRRYGIMPLPHLLYGLGPWLPPKSQTFSLQIKEAMSEIQIRRPTHAEFMLHIPKRELTSSPSCDALYVDRDSTHALPTTNKFQVATEPVILFWTKDFWYRPRPARLMYRDILSHLRCLNNFHKYEVMKKKNSLWSFKKKKISGCFIEQGGGDSNITCLCNTEYNPIADLKKSLRIDIDFSMWDFDSNIVAYQLTLLERDLFLKL